MPLHHLTQRRGRDQDHYLYGDDPPGRPTIAAKQPRRRPRVPSPPSDDDGDDDDEDRRQGLTRWLDLLNEDAQQRARGRRIRNITHTNTVTTVYEDGGG